MTRGQDRLSGKAVLGQQRGESLWILRETIFWVEERQVPKWVCSWRCKCERECKTVGVRMCECVLGEWLTVRGQRGGRSDAECAEEDRS